ncbi:MAG: bifunctional hydroxymethylpyrimidine kinase/phosphomethylpyrimidine kinase [Rhodospirillales bacterium]
MKGRVLIIAGSDSGGGAGIQADIKTVTALGGFAMTAVTALTAQNTQGVEAVFEVAPDFIAHQIRAVMDDIGADCIKLGMLHAAPVIEAVASALDTHAPGVPVIADPVMAAKGGARLLAPDAEQALIKHILPRATVLTPNAPEAAALTGAPVETAEDAERALALLLAMGPQAVLMKGGHIAGENVIDLFAEKSGARETFRSRRIETRHTHGTGCTLASALACGMAQGMAPRAAAARARAYVLKAMKTAPGFGQGHGPLNHAHTVRPFAG